ncbi:hypothetical protein [Amycolatopsis panacis]|uniref:hypothetical protein n=1 Tax=Amycolatopsis panacis TaxID=2340917 RepID=UPI0011C44A30|nr:hypothetical protein [Amycolatopsis panacis]
MILKDAQGGVWSVGRVRWLGTRQWIPIKNPRELLPSGGLTGDFVELAFLALLVLVVLIPIILGTLEYLVKLLFRPLRLLLQPSARAVGWGFDLVQVVPTGAPVDANISPVRMHIRVSTRVNARYLRGQLLALLPQGGGLQNFRVSEEFRKVEATCQVDQQSTI